MRSLFRSIQALQWAGMNKSAIARTLGVHRHTVQKYSALESAPERKPRVHKVSALAPYEDYILKRFVDGCHNATRIHKEIVEQGYPGAYNNVARVTQYLKKCECEGKPLPDSPPGLSAALAGGSPLTIGDTSSETSDGMSHMILTSLWFVIGCRAWHGHGKGAAPSDTGDDALVWLLGCLIL